jgi:hypothetical protein
VDTSGFAFVPELAVKPLHLVQFDKPKLAVMGCFFAASCRTESKKPRPEAEGSGDQSELSLVSGIPELSSSLTQIAAASVRFAS